MKTRTQELTATQAIKLAKKQFIAEHGKRSYNASVSIMQRYTGGNYVLIISSGLSTEFYYN
jgi:hypothetical protein